jgi:hypothetical protein
VNEIDVRESYQRLMVLEKSARELRKLETRILDGSITNFGRIVAHEFCQHVGRRTVLLRGIGGVGSIG